MHPGTAEREAQQALVDALAHHARAVSRTIESGVSSRQHVRSQWPWRACALAARVDDAIDNTRHRLGDASPERACAEQWLQLVCCDVVDDPRDERFGDLRRILEACRAQAEALARVRLDARAYPVVRQRLDALCVALGEELDVWHLPLARLSPLATNGVKV